MKFKLSKLDLSLIKNIVLSFLIKGGALIISILSIPAFIKYFENTVVLGLWFTILSILTWLLTFDFGIGNGLRNKLVEALHVNDEKEISRIITSSYFIIGLLSIVIIILMIPIIYFFNWNSILNISNEVISNKILKMTILISFLTIVSQFFLRTITFILYSLQRTYINNFIALITSFLQLAFVLIYPSKEIETNLLSLSIFYFISINAPLFLATILVFKKELKNISLNIKYIDKKTIKEVFNLGSKFFWNQIMFTFLTQSNIFIITYTLSPKYVVDYQIYYKIFMTFGIIMNIALAPMWSAVTKALQSNDFSWIKKYMIILISLTGLISLVQFVLVIFLKPITTVWLGNNTFHPNLYYAVVFSVFGVIFILQSVLSTFVCGLGELKIQSFFYTYGSLIKLAFVGIMIQHHNFEWIWIIVFDLVFFLIYCFVELKYLTKFLNSSLVKKIDLHSEKLG